MESALDWTLPWWIAGPILGLVIVGFLGLANKRFGVIGGSVLFGIGSGISEACPGPTAAQLGAGRVLAVAVAAGILAGVKLQPLLARPAVRTTAAPGAPVAAAEVL